MVTFHVLRGSGSGVEHRLAKARVASSNLVFRSILFFGNFTWASCLLSIPQRLAIYPALPYVLQRTAKSSCPSGRTTKKFTIVDSIRIEYANTIREECGRGAVGNDGSFHMLGIVPETGTLTSQIQDENNL